MYIVEWDNHEGIQQQRTFDSREAAELETAAEYVDISGDAIARFLVEKCGMDAIFGGGRPVEYGQWLIPAGAWNEPGRNPGLTYLRRAHDTW